jgi:membrane-associated protease RseP (regulator of RpoE activity)
METDPTRDHEIEPEDGGSGGGFSSAGPRLPLRDGVSSYPVPFHDSIPPPAEPGEPTWSHQAGPAPGHSPRHLALAGILFLLTLGSTILTGGVAYSAAIMTILLCHEMGHYVMCRRYRVRSTLPLFIPMPVSPFGTMGAVIFMTPAGYSRKAIFDIGIAGPLAGLVPATAAVLWGLAHSTVVPLVSHGFTGFRLGDSLLFRGLEKLIVPGVGANQELMLHPIAYAGWAGFFVTALNLLPIGQLDGGHVVYGLLGSRSRHVSLAALAALAVTAVFYPQWWFLVAVLVFFIGTRHRQALHDTVPLDRRRVALGIFALAIFVLAFTPQPFMTP